MVTDRGFGSFNIRGLPLRNMGERFPFEAFRIDSHSRTGSLWPHSMVGEKEVTDDIVLTFAFVYHKMSV